MIYVETVLKEMREESSLRISRKSAEELAAFLEKVAESIILEAQEYARIAGRKTLLKRDINYALERTHAKQ